MMKPDPEPTQAVEREQLPTLFRQQLPPPSPAVESPAPAMTPAQARVDAVAHVLGDAMAKASTLALTPEEIAALKADFPHEAFKLGAGGDPNLIYIEHAFLRDRFDSAIGMGQWALVRSRPHWGEEFTTAKGEKAVRLYADCALLIRGCYCAEAIGEMVYYPNNARQSYADAAEGSETAAFRRCAKKLGVGLQAWKKDFCEAWKRAQNAPQRAGSPPPPHSPAPTGKAAPTPNTEQGEAKSTPFPTPESRSKMISELKSGPDQPNRKIVTEYFQKCGCLLPTEEVEDLPLECVPSTTGQMRALGQAIAEFGNGEMAHLPYPKHEMMLGPSVEHAKSKVQPEPWMDFPMPFGNHAGKRLHDLERKYLFGLWANYKVETEYNGKAKRPETIEKDRKFREMLDAAGRHYDFKKKD